MLRPCLVFFVSCVALAGSAQSVAAQTLPSGVINSPPTVIGRSESIGSNTTLNVLEGGSVGSYFDAGLRDGSSTNVLVTISGGVVSSGFSARSGSTVNISGGAVWRAMRAEAGSTVNISGGIVGDGLYANSDSTVNITGGTVSRYFAARSGSTVTVSGGTVGRYFEAYDGSRTEFVGGEFALNGAPYLGTSITLSDNDVFTGTFADGSPFLFSDVASDQLEGVTLTQVPLPVIDTTSTVADGTGVAAPAGLRAGQTLTLRDGGELGLNFAAVNAVLNIEGGDTPAHLEVAGSEVNISGGIVNSSFNASSGSIVTISGGVVDEFFRAYSDSSVSISGGTVRQRFEVHSGSEARISGGTVGRGFWAHPGSGVTVSGGVVGRGFRNHRGSTAEFIGGEYKLNGMPYGGSSITLSDDDVFTGTFADGSPFLFASDSDGLEEVTLTPASLPAIDTTPMIVDGTNAASPVGLRAGQTLTLRDGGVLGDNFTAVDAALSIEGGIVGPDAEVAGSEVNISGGCVLDGFFANSGSTVSIRGGSVGNLFQASTGSVVNITGGTVGDNLRADSGSIVSISGGTVGGIMIANSGSTINISGGVVGEDFSSRSSTVNISGGTVGRYFYAHTDSTVNISGGTVGRYFYAHTDSTVNISGGTVGDYFGAHPGSTVNISGGAVGDASFAGSGSSMSISGGTVGRFFNAFMFSTVAISGGAVGEGFSAHPGSTVSLIGTEFYLDGSLVVLELGTPTVLSDRDAVLSGWFADGTPFEFDLFSLRVIGSDYFDANATLTLTLVPEPSAGVMAGLGVLAAGRRRRQVG